MGLDTMIFIFWMLSFKPGFSCFPFTFIKRLFSSSLLSARIVVSSAYLRLLIFLLAILIPTYDSSSPAFHMIYSACKLNKQGEHIQPWRTPFPIWNQSIVPYLPRSSFKCHFQKLHFTAWCPFFTPWCSDHVFAYRFLRRQVRWSGIWNIQNRKQN